jgi:hypothetical protein
MSQTFSAGQSLKRDCLSTCHITLAWCPGEQADYFPLPAGVDGLVLLARRYNTYARKEIKETTYPVAPDNTVHLFRSQYGEDLFFIAEYEPYRSKYKCSCGGWLCEHIKQLRGLEARV